MVVFVWWLAVWLSGNALVAINVVTLHRARLVPGWVTVFGQVNHLTAYYLYLPKLTQPGHSCVVDADAKTWKVVNRHTARCICPVSVVSQC